MDEKAAGELSVYPLFPRECQPYRMYSLPVDEHASSNFHPPLL